MALGVRDLPLQTRIALVYELTARNALGRDWTGLADYLGFTSRHIGLLDQHQRGDKAWLLFEAWERTGRSSIRLLVIALKQLKYQSSLAILLDCKDLQAVIDFEDIFAEIEQLKAEGTGGDKLVQSSLFPRFKEAEVILYPEVLSQGSEVVLYPEVAPQENSLKTEPPQSCDPRHSQSPPGTPPPTRKQNSPPKEPVCEVVQQMGPVVSESIQSKVQPTIQRNTVFISYYPESKKHKQQVAALVQQLKAQGYIVFFDELCKRDIKKNGGLTRWKERCIEVAENIVVVCSPKYYREDLELSNSYSRPKLSKLKVAVDTHLLRNLAYSGGCGRLIPVVMGRDNPNVCTPIWLQSVMIHHWPSQKLDLLHFIAGVPKFQMPPVVERIVLKPKVIDFPEAYKWDPYDMEPQEPQSL